MARYTPIRWVSALAGIDTPRRDRWSGTILAYEPDRIAGRDFTLSGAVAADVADAERALARLDAESIALTNMEALARLLLRAESVASSYIEGLVVSPQRLLRADQQRSDGREVDSRAGEILANVDAMTRALSNPHEPITVEQLCAVHGQLLAPTRLSPYAGRLRDMQNWIGGSDFSPNGAHFIPPPPELVPELMLDLCAFANEDRLPAIAQAAIAHAQFETIHPFVDGNGRTGRALIYMVLRRRGLALHAIPPISLVLATMADAYIHALKRYRYVGDPSSSEARAATEQWVEVFAVAALRAVAHAEAFEKQVEELVRSWTERLGSARSDSAALAVLKHLPAMPILTVRGAARITGRSIAAVNNALAVLLEAGILTQTGNQKRNRSFEARELIEAFADLERGLASPTGNTQVSAPNRPVPSRRRVSND